MKLNSTRKSCKDVFKAFLIENAEFDGYDEMPIIACTTNAPKENDNFILFSECISSKKYNSWIHFYEDDYLFERLWNNPKKYLSIIKKFQGIITPDFSIYRDMPLPMQKWNTYRSRAIGCWLQANGINVIVNIRWGDSRTYEFCCNGAPRNCIISIGSYGNLKDKQDRRFFANGLDYIIRTLSPTTILVFGDTPDEIFLPYKKLNISIITIKLSPTGGTN